MPSIWVWSTLPARSMEKKTVGALKSMEAPGRPRTLEHPWSNMHLLPRRKAGWSGVQLDGQRGFRQRGPAARGDQLQAQRGGSGALEELEDALGNPRAAHRRVRPQRQHRGADFSGHAQQREAHIMPLETPVLERRAH